MAKVLKVASEFKNAEVFKPTTGAINEWEGLLKQFKNSIPEAKVKGSQLFKENTQWINDVKKLGYDLLDTGGGTASPFYNLEKQAVYGKSR